MRDANLMYFKSVFKKERCDIWLNNEVKLIN